MLFLIYFWNVIIISGCLKFKICFFIENNIRMMLGFYSSLYKFVLFMMYLKEYFSIILLLLILILLVDNLYGFYYFMILIYYLYF